METPNQGGPGEAGRRLTGLAIGLPPTRGASWGHQPARRVVLLSESQLSQLVTTPNWGIGELGPGLARLAYRPMNKFGRRLLRGVYPLGAPLPHRHLARELNLRMSFLPISEVLQRPEQEGLVESKPRVGTRVRWPSATDSRERYLLREALESQAAREFAKRAGPRQGAQLQRSAAHLDQLHAPSRCGPGFPVCRAHVPHELPLA